jgi:hypothetical protein
MAAVEKGHMPLSEAYRLIRRIVDESKVEPT